MSPWPPAGSSALAISGLLLSSNVVSWTALNLAVVILGGPVQHIEGVGEVFGVRGPELEIHKGGPAGIQVLHREAEGVRGVEGGDARRAAADAVAADQLLRRKVLPVGDAVVVVVGVEDAGNFVAVGVAEGGDAGRAHVAAGEGGALQRIHQPVAVGVLRQRVQVPLLAVVDEPLHLQRVGDGVAVGVPFGGIGAQPDGLHAIRQAVAIGVHQAGVGLEHRLLLVGQAIGDGRLTVAFGLARQVGSGVATGRDALARLRAPSRQGSAPGPVDRGPRGSGRG